MNEELSNMLAAIGSMAELLYAHYDAFIKAGFDEKQAMELTLPMATLIYMQTTANKEE